MEKKAQRFYVELIEKSDKAKRECKYNASYYNQMLSELGGIQTAKRLIAKAIQTQNPSDGFTTLLMSGRTDLTMESSVIKDEYRELFTADEIDYCMSILGYK